MAMQRQTAASRSARPPMRVQHGVSVGVPITRWTKSLNKSAHTPSFNASLGHVALADGPIASDGGHAASVEGGIARGGGLVAGAEGDIATGGGLVAAAEGGIARGGGLVAAAEGGIARGGGLVAAAEGGIARGGGHAASIVGGIARGGGLVAGAEGGIATGSGSNRLVGWWLELTRVKKRRLKVMRRAVEDRTFEAMLERRINVMLSMFRVMI
ncbi:hypothetical protein LIER_31361 [Lithospermum erythrorhizon]|uniref:Uncharacterized protein n=1 Tax=Lithospermum erythrorhizon TaxID=34254 RepID=A0AAV3RST0_LITER